MNFYPPSSISTAHIRNGHLQIEGYRFYRVCDRSSAGTEHGLPRADAAMSSQRRVALGWRSVSTAAASLTETPRLELEQRTAPPPTLLVESSPAISGSMWQGLQSKAPGPFCNAPGAGNSPAVWPHLGWEGPVETGPRSALRPPPTARGDAMQSQPPHGFTFAICGARRRAAK